MKKRLNGRLKKLFYSAARKTRPGIGLPTALVIVILCSMLISVMFNMAANFMFQTNLQQDSYVAHSIVAGYIEQAKGELSYKYAANGKMVHSERLAQIWNARSNRLPEEGIRTSDDLLIPTNFDEDVGGAHSMGRTHVRVRLFDVSYEVRDLNSDYITDEDGVTAIKTDFTSLTPEQRVERLAALATMPPPVKLQPNEDDGPMERVSERPGTTDTYDPVGNYEKSLDPDIVGTYMLRVELLDENDEPIRLAEQVFYQVASEL